MGLMVPRHEEQPQDQFPATSPSPSSKYLSFMYHLKRDRQSYSTSLYKASYMVLKGLSLVNECVSAYPEKASATYAPVPDGELWTSSYVLRGMLAGLRPSKEAPLSSFTTTTLEETVYECVNVYVRVCEV